MPEQKTTKKEVTPEMEEKAKVAKAEEEAKAKVEEKKKQLERDFDIARDEYNDLAEDLDYLKRIIKTKDRMKELGNQMDKFSEEYNAL